MCAVSDPQKKEDEKRCKYSIGIDIGKRKCIACIMDDKKRIQEETAYEDASKEASLFARKAKLNYGRNCQAVCESAGNMWPKTCEAFESAGIPKLASTYRMRIISDMDVKTDPIDARRFANALRAGMVPECYVAPPELRSVRELIRCRIGPVQARTAVINRIHSLPDRYDGRIDSSHVYSKGLRQLTDMAPDDPNDGGGSWRAYQKGQAAHGGDCRHRDEDSRTGRRQRGCEDPDEHSGDRLACGHAAGI